MKKTYQQIISLIRGQISTTTPVLFQSIRVLYTQSSIMDELHLTNVSILHDMNCPLKIKSKERSIMCIK